ncbi:MAG: hypothetical protein HOD99_10485 [Planctomycetaceae bacterium]|nr:hypothetical protein [Planctomycetaceae bacterium]
MSQGKQSTRHKYFFAALCYWAAILVIFMVDGTYSYARPWADRALIRKSGRVERAELRERSRRDNSEESGNSSAGIAVITPDNFLRPLVVRRLTRRGLTIEEINSLTRGTQQTRGWERDNTPEAPRQLGQRSQAAMPIATEVKTPRQLSNGQLGQNGLKATGTTVNEVIPSEQTASLKRYPTQSILVGGEEAIAPESDTVPIDTGPAFPGLQKQQQAVEATPIITHDPIELLPTPKPNK